MTYHARAMAPWNEDSYWFGGGRGSRRSFGRLGAQQDFGPVSITAERLLQGDAVVGAAGPRPSVVQGHVIPNYVGRREGTPEGAGGFVGAARRDADRGHLMALSLGGPNHELNIVPQWSRWQRHEAWRRMERQVRSAAVNCWRINPAARVWFRVEIVYPFASNSRSGVMPRLEAWAFPTAFLVTAVATVAGHSQFVDFGGMPLNRLRFEGFPDRWHG